MGGSGIGIRAAVAALVLVAATGCGGGAATADPGGTDPGTDRVATDAGDAAATDPGGRDAAAEAVATDPGGDEAPADPGMSEGGDPGALPDEGAVEVAAGDAGDPGTGDAGSPDGASDAAPDGAGEDAAPGDGTDATAAAVTVEVSPAAPGDVVASYLMSASPAAWNLLGGADLPLGRHWDEGHVGYHAAIRFPGVPVPAGAVIESAILSWVPTNEVDSSNILWLDVSAEAAADSAPLSLTDYEAGRPDQRLRTSAAVRQWVIRCNDACTDLTEYDCPQRMRDCWDRAVRYECPKDLAAVVQEVVDLPGWAAGNALTVFLDPDVPQDYADRDTSSRSVTGVDPERGEGSRPVLRVTYRAGGR